MITHVAIKYAGQLYALPSPNRHHDVIRMIGGVYGDDEQGVLNSEGKFLTRREAMDYAILTKQFKRPYDPKLYQGDLLFSEDLW